MLSKGKVALQSLAERLRERGLGEVPQGWCKKLGQLVKAVDKKTQALEDWWKYTISEPAKARRLWFIESIWADGIFRLFVYIVIILYFMGS